MEAGNPSGLAPWGRLRIESVETSSAGDGSHTLLKASVRDRGARHSLSGIGNGPIDAFLSAIAELGIDAGVLDYVEHAMSEGEDATAAAYVECRVGDQSLWGVGLDPSITNASLKAIVSAVNRAER